jgi:hypothetical protein
MEDDFVAYLEVLTFICFSLLHSDGSVQEAFVTFWDITEDVLLFLCSEIWNLINEIQCGEIRADQFRDGTGSMAAMRNGLQK